MPIPTCLVKGKVTSLPVKTPSPALYDAVAIIHPSQTSGKGDADVSQDSAHCHHPAILSTQHSALIIHHSRPRIPVLLHLGQIFEADVDPQDAHDFFEFVGMGAETVIHNAPV